MRGTVTDPSGAAIPGAKVELVGGTLAGGTTATTDAVGAFQFLQIPPGTAYTISVTASGFRTAKLPSVGVNVGKATVLEVKLEVGQVSESVVVTGEAILVDTQSSSSAVNVDRSFFDLIPKGRSFYDLIAVAPGARNEGKAGGFEIDGASGSENVFYVDGMDVTDVQQGYLAGRNRIPNEMVQQVQIKNGVMDAEYGGAMGGVVNATVRSGSNDFHGQVGFYFDNNVMAAHPRDTLQIDPNDETQSKYQYFVNTMDDYKTFNPVVNIGGPLIKNRLFFFSGYMPTTTTTTRNVTFLGGGGSGTFENKYRQQYMNHKLDFVPTSKIRMNMSWIWNPNYNRGFLPARQGTSDPKLPWGLQGNYTASNILHGQIDYMATSKLLFTFGGGHNFTNFTDRYALSNNTFIYSTANTQFTGLPAEVVRTFTGWVQSGSARTDYNIYPRNSYNASVSYMANFLGQHNFKGGWQTNRMGNNVKALTYPTGYYRFYWGQSYACVTSQCSGKQTGKYGYYRWYTYGTYGDASSDNQSIFFQDTWKVNRKLTLNLGLRTEREFLPSFSKVGIAAAPPIEFSWGEKLSPRIGMAFDPKGDGKMRIYGSWGYFYDLMKYEMPRGSFGGDIYITNYYSLDDPNVMTQLKTYGYPSDPTKLPGRLFESVNWRIPSNDPNNNTVDPNLKPMKQQMFDLGFDYTINPTLATSVRYTNRRLIRTIEDVGTLGPDGEIYYIANPGYGIVADPATWEAGIPPTPKAKRNYDAVEVRLDKRFSRNYQFTASYTYSHLTGNYSGLASSDENGRTSPNVNRYFDLPWVGLNEQGKLAEGVLATDRPSTLKFFGVYSKKHKLGTTSFSPIFVAYSGTPLTTQLNAISSVPIYPYGRGDMGRTPFFTNTDFTINHEFAPFKSREQMKIRFEFTVFNLFNTVITTDVSQNYLNPASAGQLQFDNNADIFKGFNTKNLMAAQGDTVDPLYGLANGFQGPRSARIQLSFFF